MMFKTSLKCTLVAAMVAASGGYASAAIVDVSGDGHTHPNDSIGAGNTANLVGDTTFGYGTGTTDIDVILNGFTFTVDSGNGNATRVNNVISGDGNVVLVGRYEVFHTGWRNDDLGLGGTSANTYTGPTTLAKGVLHLYKPDNVTAITGDLTIVTGPDPADVVWHANNQIGDSSNIVITDGNGGPNAIGYLTLNGFNDTVTSLTLAANSIVNTGGYELINDVWELSAGENGGYGVLTVSSLVVDGQAMAFGQYTSANSDFVIGDGYINVIPEPASLALIGLGGLLMLRRRH